MKQVRKVFYTWSSYIAVVAEIVGEELWKGGGGGELALWAGKN